MPHSQYIRHVENADLAVLFVHGFLGSPKHFEEFIKSVSENTAVYNILLEGHNGTVSDFGRASMEKWRKQVDKAVCELVERYGKIVIVGHSMGTFFAMEAAVKYKDNVKCIMLLQSPLKIGLKVAAPVNTVKSFFTRFSDDPVAVQYRNAHSVDLSLRFWEYIRWIPRYFELFCSSRRSRQTILSLSVPTYIFQSKKDELVSMKSVKYIPSYENIKLTVLENSAHFIYDKADFENMLKCFSSLL